jgi:hypothetical protein
MLAQTLYHAAFNIARRIAVDSMQCYNRSRVTLQKLGGPRLRPASMLRPWRRHTASGRASGQHKRP